ncbi:MAG TPA: YibE/F family protein, partial [Actinomycetales bacterium]|nr:YibE/F family protein [Actinomycetales bacterium]
MHAGPHPGPHPGHGHTHAHTAPPLDPAQRRRVRGVLAAVTLPLLLATLIGLVWLWPRGESPIGSLPIRAEGAEIAVAEVTRITPLDASGEPVTAEPGQPDPELDPFLGAEVRGLLTSGLGAGTEVPIQVPGEILVNGLDVGDEIQVIFTSDAMGTGSPYVFYDFERGPPLILLTLAYLAVVALVARWRGLAAVLGLGASLGVTAVFVLPALMAGSPPIPVVVVGASAMMFLAVYLAHGVSIRTTTALLGTYAGLVITAVLGYIAIGSAELTGAQSDMSLVISTVFPELRLRDLLLCGLIIAGLGALNDVTITQASAVWELHAVNPNLPRTRLWSGGMRIGRDHIASTVYTLAFAYVGTALPMLLVASLIDRSFLEFLTAGEIAEEIVRTLVSSIGLILAIPITTALAALLVPSGDGATPAVTDAPPASPAPAVAPDGATPAGTDAPPAS